MASPEGRPETDDTGARGLRAPTHAGHRRPVRGAEAVQHVLPLPGCALLLLCGDGYRLASALWMARPGGRFAALADDTFFRQVRLLPGGVLGWPGGLAWEGAGLRAHSVPVDRDALARFLWAAADRA